jgi:O-antigen/teichoic acid export membrane protein
MLMKIRSIGSSFLRLAAGEACGRLATFTLYAYISRQFGLQVFGIVALAQTVASYVMEFSDQGLKLIGARLLARNDSLANFVVPTVVKKRTLFTLLAVSAGAFYALVGPVPSAARMCVLLFVAAAIPYSLALDWVAWGLGRFGVLSLWRGGVSVVYVLLAIVAMQSFGRPVAAIAGANFFSALLGAAFLLLIWRVRWRTSSAKISLDDLGAAEKELRFRSVLTLGTANLLNLVFMNADILLLAALTGTGEVGRYSAACKPLYIIFTGFWLLTDAMYPHLARMEAAGRAHRLLLLTVGVVAVVASLAAAIIGVLAPRLLTFIYGSTLGAEGLFRILLIALPIDFCFSLLWTVLVSRGYQRPVLYALAAAAASNVLLNLVLIPRFRAQAAAWVTVGSYALLFLVLLVFVLCNKVLSVAPTHNVAEAGVAWA